MTSKQIKPANNYLLSYLSKSQCTWFLEHCTLMQFEFGEILNSMDEPIKYVYFPITAFISMLEENNGEQPLEMGLIGTEGMLGATLALGNRNAPMTFIVQGAGSVLRLEAQLFIERIKQSPEVSKLIHYYLYVLMQQLAQTSVCNRFHEVKERLARWLLMTQDRTYSNQLHLSHQFLAKMLGVRRSAITIAAGLLQQQGLITYSRGQITVVSRSGLELKSCKCYRSDVNAYQKNLTNLL